MHGIVNAKDDDLHIIKMNHLHEGSLKTGLCMNCKIMVEFRNRKKQEIADEMGFKTFGEKTNKEIKRDEYILKGICLIAVAFVIFMIYMVINHVINNKEEEKPYLAGFTMQNLGLEPQGPIEIEYEIAILDPDD